MVPNRGKQQHLNVAVNSTGSLVAVLAYDNRLRIMDMQNKKLLTHISVAPLFDFDVWDIDRGVRHPVPRTPSACYSDQVGLDVEITLEFSQDDSMLVLSSRNLVRLYRVLDSGTRIELFKQISCDQFLQHTLGSVDYSQSVSGAATLSPDGKSFAWIIFARSPASVFATFWDVNSASCTAFSEVTSIHPRRWSALGWARLAYTPNGLYCIIIANAAKKLVRMERINEHFVRTKLCRFFFAAFETPQYNDQHFTQISPIKEKCEWLELGCTMYSQQLGSCIATLIDGLHVHSTTNAYNRDSIDLTTKAQLRQPGLVFNSVHSCPAEATYKALMFGSSNSHSWFVTKQPMYSLHFGMDGSRIQIVTSPHANHMQTLLRRTDSPLDGESGKHDFAPREYRDGDSRVRRRHAFKSMPWRTSFATVTAFSTNGKWLVGASLLDEDMCNVCLRNLTINEYFG